MNLKKGQLVTGLRLKTDLHVYFELKTVLLTRCIVYVLQDSDQAWEKCRNYAHCESIKEFLGDNVVMIVQVKYVLFRLIK
jgi:hypothetical protein